MRCKDPCPGLCGINADCYVANHQGTCQCRNQYTGDPFVQCNPIPSKIFSKSQVFSCLNLVDSYLVHTPVEIATPCDPSPCGANAVCKERNGAGSCACIPEYYGDPYSVCRPECTSNSDCDNSKACINQKCKDPCPGACGNGAQCIVVNHRPTCECFNGYTGNPSTGCREIPRSKSLLIKINRQKNSFFHF
jgi:hypothetical protein